MKKLTALLLALLIAAAALLACAELTTPADIADTTGPEEEVTEYVTLTGFVTEVTDASIAFTAADGSTYIALLTEETGMNLGAALQKGDWVQVLYNGMLTRSIPAQLTALHVNSFRLDGVISDVAFDENGENGSFLLTQEDGTQVQVNAAAGMLTLLADGERVTVYYDGRMTFSLPGQVWAEYIRGEMLAGCVTELSEDGFVMDLENGEAAIVHVSESTLCYTAIEPGMNVLVATDGTMALSLPAQFVAVEVFAADAAEIADDTGANPETGAPVDTEIADDTDAGDTEIADDVNE